PRQFCLQLAAHSLSPCAQLPCTSYRLGASSTTSTSCLLLGPQFAVIHRKHVFAYKWPGLHCPLGNGRSCCCCSSEGINYVAMCVCNAPSIRHLQFDRKSVHILRTSLRLSAFAIVEVT